jgi:hypothetical protein
VTATQVKIVNNHWYVNGEIANPGTRAEGLLMNVRMVNSTFEDLSQPRLDAWDITDRFIRRIPEYASSGVGAFTICLQGGYPGYLGAVNSAFDANGSLKKGYLERVRYVIEACDRVKVIVILGCYYQLQSGILRDEAAVRQGITNTVDWVRENDFTNVVLEVANEFGQDGFSHTILRKSAGIVELINIAKQIMPGLLVSASRQGDLGIVPEVCMRGDFSLVHLNRVALEQYPALLQEIKAFGKPVVCNEDRKTGTEGAMAAEVSVENGCSWGLNVRDVNQYNPPFRFNGIADDPLVYMKLKDLTSRIPQGIRNK